MEAVCWDVSHIAWSWWILILHLGFHLSKMTKWGSVRRFKDIMRRWKGVHHKFQWCPDKGCWHYLPGIRGHSGCCNRNSSPGGEVVQRYASWSNFLHWFLESQVQNAEFWCYYSKRMHIGALWKVVNSGLAIFHFWGQVWQSIPVSNKAFKAFHWKESFNITF